MNTFNGWGVFSHDKGAKKPFLYVIRRTRKFAEQELRDLRDQSGSDPEVFNKSRVWRVERVVYSIVDGNYREPEKGELFEKWKALAGADESPYFYDGMWHCGSVDYHTLESAIEDGYKEFFSARR